MFLSASRRSAGWTTSPELVDDFTGIRMLQAEHRQNLLRWLAEQIEAGVTVEQLCRRLAA